MKFTGTEKYVATDDLQMAVNAAIALQRPLNILAFHGAFFNDIPNTS